MNLPRARAALRSRRLGVGLAAGAALLNATTLPAQTPPVMPDPFGGVEVRQLVNGLTVWYQRFPGATSTSLSLTIPAGSDRDPVGREELAHVVEHALFAGRDGVTREQIATAITDRGGSFNAATSPSRTVLWVSVAREHSDFALDWLHGLVAPRIWTDTIMPDVRAAVALELGLAPRTLLGRVRDDFILRPGLLPPRFWQREFGLSVPEYRHLDRYAALQRIAAGDVAAFLQAHYVPARMLLVIGGDLNAAGLARHVDATFGQLPAWLTAEPDTVRPQVKQTATRRYFWNLRDDISLRLAFRLDSLTADDHVRLLFAQQLLQRRLMRRLRWGEEQAVYGVRASVVRRGRVAMLQLEARTTAADFRTAWRVLQDEVQRLRHGRYPPNEFEQDRAALAGSLRLNQGSPAALRSWHADVFYDPALHPTPPPLGARVAALTAAELSAFAGRWLTVERELLSVERPLPLGEGGAAAILIGAMALGVVGARRWLLRPIEVERLRYLARLRWPLALRLLLGGALGLLVLGGGRLLAAALHALGSAYVLPHESFMLQATFLLVVLALATFLLAAAGGLVPHRVLVFEHELRIKYLAYRTRVFPPETLLEVRLATFQEVWLDAQLWHTIPLTFGWRRPGVLIRTKQGRDWFLAVRDPAGLMAATRHLQPPTGAAVSAPPDCPAPP